MARYASWSELEVGVPRHYTEGATPEAFRSGLAGVAPPGKRPKEGRVSHYASGVEGKGPLVVSRWGEAMFE